MAILILCLAISFYTNLKNLGRHSAATCNASVVKVLHLLRMLVRLPALLQMTYWDEDEILIRIACILFLRQKAPFILDVELDYRVADAEWYFSFFFNSHLCGIWVFSR
ncbi:hypothetical protein KIN20_002190 [Parelaphostrongylus tenuis]|uniref:Uncharacterized protein n=1 Tax=Parelaphostrongylus tenuis TaxID=148309 RepID=A0AAD5LVA0_PARTN|nr:hypothetical protein KIN20_002190 [Parelaphostrongylus tenuis]